jgi:hypothetical protein
MGEIIYPDRLEKLLSGEEIEVGHPRSPIQIHWDIKPDDVIALAEKIKKSRSDLDERKAKFYSDIMNNAPVLPQELAGSFGEFGPVAFDASSGEAIGWGFKPLGRLGDDRFDAAGKHGRWECIDHINAKWVLITKRLTPFEAFAVYGGPVVVTSGPRGGFRGVAYGSKKFVVRELDPRQDLKDFTVETVR